MDWTPKFSKWLWTPDWKQQDREESRVVCYRKKIDLAKQAEHYRILISADSRYKLYVNGILTGAGSAEGDGS